MKLNLSLASPLAFFISLLACHVVPAFAEDSPKQVFLAESVQKASPTAKTSRPSLPGPSKTIAPAAKAPAKPQNTGRAASTGTKAAPQKMATVPANNAPAATATPPAIPGLPAGKMLWTNINDGFQKARTYKKLIIADIYTDWCGWCKRLDKETFHNENVEQYLSQNFIGMKVNAEDQAAGEALAKKYAVNGYPTILFFDANGNYKDKFEGFAGPNDFPKIADKVLRGEKLK